MQKYITADQRMLQCNEFNTYALNAWQQHVFAIVVLQPLK
jgi:hypothetical protein